MPDINPVRSSRDYTPAEEERSAETGTRAGQTIKDHFAELRQEIKACVQPRKEPPPLHWPTPVSAKTLLNPALRASPPAKPEATEDPVQMSPEGNGPTCAPPKPAPEDETSCREVDRHPKLSARETKNQGEITQGHPLRPNEAPGYAVQQQLAIQASVRTDPIAAVMGGVQMLRGASREEVYKTTQTSDAVWDLATAPAGGNTGAASRGLRVVPPQGPPPGSVTHRQHKDPHH